MTCLRFDKTYQLGNNFLTGTVFIFGSSGLATSETPEIFQQRVSINSEFISSSCPDFSGYYSTKVVTALGQYMKISPKFNIKKEDREVCSSDGMLILKGNPWAGKKSRLRKRKEKIRCGCAKRN